MLNELRDYATTLSSHALVKHVFLAQIDIIERHIKKSKPTQALRAVTVLKNTTSLCVKLKIITVAEKEVIYEYLHAVEYLLQADE